MQMQDILNYFEPITLEQMSGVKLMNRTDTKFVTNREKLQELLQLAQQDYYGGILIVRRYGSVPTAVQTFSLWR